MKRAALEKSLARTARARHLQIHGPRPGRRSAVELGRFRKTRRIGGCGNSECWLCHGDKLAGELRPAERRAAHAFKEGLAGLPADRARVRR